MISGHIICYSLQMILPGEHPHQRPLSLVQQLLCCCPEGPESGCCELTRSAKDLTGHPPSTKTVHPPSHPARAIAARRPDSALAFFPHAIRWLNSCKKHPQRPIECQNYVNSMSMVFIIHVYIQIHLRAAMSAKKALTVLFILLLIAK